MEKMKCSSCGGDIVIDKDKEYGKCSYCGTKYNLNNNINYNIKLDDNTKEILNKGAKHFSKLFILPIIIFVIVLATVIFLIFKFNSGTNSFNKTSFNNQFFHANGTQNAFFLTNTLDNIVQSNKTHKRKVILEYEDKETTNEKEIIEIKHSLSGNYEVSFDYDKDGFINKIIIEKIK